MFIVLAVFNTWDSLYTFITINSKGTQAIVQYFLFLSFDISIYQKQLIKYFILFIYHENCSKDYMYPLTVCNGNISFTFDRISDFCANAISPKRYRKLVKAMLLLFNRNLIKCFDIKDTHASHTLFMVIKRKQTNKIAKELEVKTHSCGISSYMPNYCLS